MHGINRGLILGQVRALDKESINTVERLQKCCPRLLGTSEYNHSVLRGCN